MANKTALLLKLEKKKKKKSKEVYRIGHNLLYHPVHVQVYLTIPVLIICLCKKPPHALDLKATKSCNCPSLHLLKKKAMYRLNEF